MPIPLSAAGQATVYTRGAVDLLIEDSTGATVSLHETSNGISAASVEVVNPGYSGPDATGTLVAGGKTSLDAILTSAAASFGGADFNFKESSGATAVPLQTSLRDLGISARSFGAKGDGSADDTSALQAWLNRCVSFGSGTVAILPPGTYNISSLLTIGQVQGLTIRGGGPRSTKIVQLNNTLGGLSIGISGGTSNDVTLENLQISAASLSSGTGLILSNVTRPILRTITVNTYTNGVQLTASCTKPLITDDCTIAATGGAGLLVGSAGTNHNLMVSDSSLSGTTAASLTNADQSMFSNVVFGGTNGIVAATCTGGLSVFGSPSLAAGTVTPFTITGGDPGFTQAGNLIEGYTEDVASGGTVNPDWTRGYSIRYRGTSTGVAYVINLPTVTPTRRGVVMKFELFNNAGGAVTGWTFNAGYHRSASAVSLVDLHHTTITFEYDLALGFWREIGFSDTT